MDTDLHYWWTKQQTIRAKKTLFSEFADKYIPNKFYLGKFLEIKAGEANPYERWREDARAHYEVFVPTEFEKLQSLIPDARLWHYRDISVSDAGSEGAFEIVIFDDLAIGAFVNVIYGEKTGIIGLEIRSWSSFVCDLPSDFDLDALIKLLKSDFTSFNDFALHYGRLNRAQRQRIEKYGI